MSLIIKGRAISRGKGTGELLVSREPITFLSGVDPETGLVIEKGHPLMGKSVAGRVLVFPFGKGSTVGSYVIYALMKNGKGPVAIINTEAEPIIAVGAIIAGIPMIDRPEVPLERFKNGVTVTVDGESGECVYEGDLD